MSWQQIAGSIDPSCLTLYTSAALWTIIYDSVYSHQVTSLSLPLPFPLPYIIPSTLPLNSHPPPIFLTFSLSSTYSSLIPPIPSLHLPLVTTLLPHLPLLYLFLPHPTHSLPPSLPLPLSKTSFICFVVHVAWFCFSNAFQTLRIFRRIRPQIYLGPFTIRFRPSDSPGNTS